MLPARWRWDRGDRDREHRRLDDGVSERLGASYGGGVGATSTSSASSGGAISGNAAVANAYVVQDPSSDPSTATPVVPPRHAELAVPLREAPTAGAPRASQRQRTADPTPRVAVIDAKHIAHSAVSTSKVSTTRAAIESRAALKTKQI